MRLFRATWIVCVFVSTVSGQVTQWRETGENGTTYVVDGTQSSYLLLQNELAAEGDYAFHLTNANFSADWFALDQDVSVDADTQLFFLSQLRAATPDQVAQVRLSTDGGSTWPNVIFDQPGNGFPGEAAFSLQEVSLGDYAGQDVRLQFQLDFSFGSAFTGTEIFSGWLIDDIQIGPTLQKLQFSVGDPSAAEQEYLEFINRARADALVEANRLRYETTPAIQNAYSFFDVNPADIQTHYEYYVDQQCIDQHAQPLSFSQTLMTAATLHSQDMFANEFQAHVSSNSPPEPLQPNDTFGERLDRVGYRGSAGENIYSFAESASHGHAGFAVDWGNSAAPGATCYNPAFQGQGLQNPAGHRINIHDGSFKEVGIGIVEGTNGSVGPQVVTQNFGNPGDVAYVTGVVFEDVNQNDFYDAGEGRGGVRVDIDGSAYFAISTDSGAYSIPVPEDGEYTVSFQGDGYEPIQTNVAINNGLNVKVDYLVEMAANIACDLNGDGQCFTDDLAVLFSAGDLTVGFVTSDTTQTFDLNTDGRVDGEDLAEWLASAAVNNGLNAAYLAGDGDLDGDVDFADFLGLSASFGQVGTWSDGNFDGSSTVDFADFLQLSGNFGNSIAAAQVPEPATVGAMFGGVILCLTASRRQQRGRSRRQL